MKSVDKILCSLLKINEIDLDQNISMKSHELWDSVFHMELILTLEEELSVEFSMDEIMNMTNIKSITEIVSKKLN